MNKIDILIGIMMVGLLLALIGYALMMPVNIESGHFVKAECHLERMRNVTWILLEEKELIYCTYNPDVLNLTVGEKYWFAEGWPNGNYGKTLLFVSNDDPVTNVSGNI